MHEIPFSAKHILVESHDYHYRSSNNNNLSNTNNKKENISVDVEITKEAVHLIHNKAKSFRQIVNTIDVLEKVAQVNGLTQINENIAQEILNG